MAFFLRSVAAVVMLGSSAAAFARPQTDIRATPPGITLQPTRAGVYESAPGTTVIRTITAYGDAQGSALYTTDKDTQPGVSTCNDECAAAWPPAIAQAAAKPFGDWSVIRRADGTRQWAFKGKPLYSFAKDVAVGDAKGKGVDGWHLAALEAADGMALPYWISVREVPGAGGQVLVDGRGMTLYLNDSNSPQLNTRWRPVMAGGIAHAVGEFTVARRADGLQQWAFRGKPLYTFDGDFEPGDANGVGIDTHWNAALVVRYFMPPGVAIHHTPTLGDILTGPGGMTLYARERSRFIQSHNLRNERGYVAVGRALGTSTCDIACTRQWRPFVAGKNAEPSGHWDVVTRGDGTRQWAYLGYPLYTYAGDKKPGDMAGNDDYEFLNGADPFLAVDAVDPALGSVGARAMFWRAAAP